MDFVKKSTLARAFFMKIKTYFDTKYTRLRLFVKRLEKLLNSLDILKNNTTLIYLGFIFVHNPFSVMISIYQIDGILIGFGYLITVIAHGIVLTNCSGRV